MDQFDHNESVEEAPSIKKYLVLFWHWIWIIILSGVVAGIAAFIVSINMTPIYESSVRLLVSEPPSTRSLDYSAMVSSQTMTKTYSEMIIDTPVLQGVIDTLKLNLTPKDLEEKITVELVLNTQLLDVSVRDPNPKLSTDIANTIASVFAARIRELQSQRYASTRGGLEKQVADMESQIQAINDEIKQTSDSNKQDQLEARLTQYRNLYSGLVTNFEQVRLAEAQTSTNVVVSEPANVPTIPVIPKTLLNTVIAALAGIFLAVGVILIADALTDTINNPDIIRQQFHLSILGMIAQAEMPENKPVTLAEPRSPISESFRSLRTNISFNAVDMPLRRILVTSPTPQDGKTTISSNLAVVMAQGEKKVILIDADLRRPKVHTRFGLLNRFGLSDLFLKSIDILQSVIQTTDVPRLSVLTTGSIPPNPAELLTSNRMFQILEKLAQEYDLTIIDTPPVLTVTDAAALTSLVDGVILVIKPGHTKMEEFKRTVEQLRDVGARILGVVLNEVEPGSRKYGYYYSKYTYAYAYGSDRSKKKKRIRLEKKNEVTSS